VPDPTDQAHAHASWLDARTSRGDVADLPRALAAKGATTISVILPARGDEPAAGRLVAGLRATLVDRGPLVDEVVVVDDGCSDATVTAARRAGARVVVARDLLPTSPDDRGKGGALWSGLAATTGDLVVFLDADVATVPPSWVASLVLPLLVHEQVRLVKAAYDRPLDVGGVAHPGSGGRVTRLVARPVLGLVAPELTWLAQPLAGETAARRDLLESLPFASGYGVETGLLLDTWAAHGMSGIAQVDLGARSNRHHSDAALEAMATSVLRVTAARAGWRTAEPVTGHRGRREDEPLASGALRVPVADLPPLAHLRTGARLGALVRPAAG
jgi:glucosyl-3-phosphoglycerate synthase